MIEKNDNPFSIWKHIHFIGKINLDLEHPKLFRYEYYSRFKSLYNKMGESEGKIIFPSPLSWPDLFEQRFLSDNFLRYCFEKEFDPNEFRNSFFALCCTGDGTENADAQWNTRKTEKGNFCIRYTCNLWKLLSQLECFSKYKAANSVDFYVSSISYKYSQEELLQNLHVKSLGPPKGNDRIPYLIRAMSYKRSPFKFENEIRIWAIVKKEALSLGLIKDNMLSIPLDWKNLEINILVGPYKSETKIDEFDNLIDYNRSKRKECSLVQHARVDRIFEDLGISKDRIKISRLYDVFLWKGSKNMGIK